VTASYNDESYLRRSNRYAEWRILGKGGTATVYRVRDKDLGCDVAIKVLKPEILQSSVSRDYMIQGLRNEVLISRRLRHENICAIHDLYDGPEGFGTVMDLIDGVELRDWMNRHLNDRLATARERLELLRRLGEALAYAHTAIVHRDLKPQNIFLRNNDINKPIIMDFGFSIIGEKTDKDTSNAFTPKYMAPEQYETPDKVDRRADLFALGIMAYELFTGEVPPNSLKDILKTRKPPRIPLEMIRPPSSFNAAVKPALDRLILQLTAYEPERRIQSAEDLVAVLRRPEDLIYLDQPGPVVQGGTQRRADRAVAIEGGDYLLGSRPGQKTTRDNELPTKKVKLTPFLIDPCPVTNREYLEFAHSTGYAAPPLHQDPVFGAPDHPVVGVSYDDALAFARWAGGSLPSEAQWECAARGGRKQGEYPWGEEPVTPARANINNIARGTTPVAAFPEGATPQRVHDLCGNVWEWCLDAYQEKYYQQIPIGSINPVNNPPVNSLSRPQPECARTIRGGSFQSVSIQGRCAFRAPAKGNEPRNDIGFRLVYRKE